MLLTVTPLNFAPHKRINSFSFSCQEHMQFENFDFVFSCCLQSIHPNCKKTFLGNWLLRCHHAFLIGATFLGAKLRGSKRGKRKNKILFSCHLMRNWKQKENIHFSPDCFVSDNNCFNLIVSSLFCFNLILSPSKHLMKHRQMMMIFFSFRVCRLLKNILNDHVCFFHFPFSLVYYTNGTGF